MKRIATTAGVLVVLAFGTGACSGPNREASTTTPTSSVAQPKTQTVTFRGISFAVPWDWKIRDGGCEDGQSAVYVGDPAGASCGAYAQKGTSHSYVMKLQTMDAAQDVNPEPVTINGFAGLLKDYGQWLLVVFPSQKVGVEIRYWEDRALAQRVLDSMNASP